MTQNQLNLTQPPRLGGHGGPFGGRPRWGGCMAGSCRGDVAAPDQQRPLIASSALGWYFVFFKSLTH